MSPAWCCTLGGVKNLTCVHTTSISVYIYKLYSSLATIKVKKCNSDSSESSKHDTNNPKQTESHRDLSLPRKCKHYKVLCRLCSWLCLQYTENKHTVKVIFSVHWQCHAGIQFCTVQSLFCIITVCTYNNTVQKERVVNTRMWVLTS